MNSRLNFLLSVSQNFFSGSISLDILQAFSQTDFWNSLIIFSNFRSSWTSFRQFPVLPLKSFPNFPLTVFQAFFGKFLHLLQTIDTVLPLDNFLTFLTVSDYSLTYLLHFLWTVYQACLEQFPGTFHSYIHGFYLENLLHFPWAAFSIFFEQFPDFLFFNPLYFSLALSWTSFEPFSELSLNSFL